MARGKSLNRIVWLVGRLVLALLVGALTTSIVTRNATLNRDIKAFLFSPVPAGDRAFYDTGYGFNDEQSQPVAAAQLGTIALGQDLAGPTKVSLDFGSGPVRPVVAPNARGGAAVPAERQGNRLVYTVAPGSDGFALLFPPGSEPEQILIAKGTGEAVIRGIGANDRESLFVVRDVGSTTEAAWTGAAFVLSRWAVDARLVRAVQLASHRGGGTQSCDPCFAAVLSDDQRGFALRPWNAAREGIALDHRRGPRTTPPPVWAAVQIVVPLALSVACFFATGPSLLGRRASSQREAWTAAAIVLGWALFFGFFLAAWWPGMVTVDSLSPPIQAMAGSYGIWYGIGHPLVTTIMAALSDHRYTVLVQWTAHVAFFSIVCLALIRERVFGLTGFSIAYLCLFTFVDAGAVYLYRDALSGLLSCSALFILWRIYTTGRPHPTGALRAFVALLACTGVAVAYRQDNLILSGAVAFAPLVLGRHWKSFFGLSAGIVAALIGVRVLTTAVAGDTSAESRNYAVTAVINGIGAVVSTEGYAARDRERVRAVVSRVIDYEIISSQWTPYHSVYWHQHANMRPTSQEVRDLQIAYLELAALNPVTFLIARTKTMMGTLGVSGHTIHMDDMLRHGAGRKLARDFGYWQDRSGALTQAAVWILEVKKQVATTLPQFLIVCGILLWFRRIPVTAYVASVLFVKFIIFFFLQPASVFSYVYDLHVFGVLLLPMAAAEARMRARADHARGLPPPQPSPGVARLDQPNSPNSASDGTSRSRP